MMPKIKVLGVGGSGSNTVSRIAKFGNNGVELVAVNTDAQALYFCKVPNKILIGKNITKGLGAGMDILLGRAAAEESKEKISEDLGILTVAVVTSPFSFEGNQRKQIATKAIENLKGKVDSLLIISNDKLLKTIDEKTTVSDAFKTCDDILRQAVQAITDLILAPGIINVDFASVVSIMKNSGQTLFGT